MHCSITLSLSQTIWPRWASRQFLTLPIVQTLLPVTFGYSLSSEAVVMRQLRRWKRLWRRSLTHLHKRTSMGPSRGCWDSRISALQPEEIPLKGTRISCVYYQEKYPHEKCLETYLMILVHGCRGIILWIELPWPENPANTCTWHMEPLDSGFDLIRFHQQCIPYMPWLVNLALLVCDVDRSLSGRVSALWSLVRSPVGEIRTYDET